MRAKRVGGFIVGALLIAHSICVLAIASTNSIGGGPSTYIPGMSLGGIQVVSADWPIWPSCVLLLVGVSLVYRAIRRPRKLSRQPPAPRASS
jgi:hypothetical protein